ncbi:MAG: cytochrome ubiquinol oxidase subunit I [Hamadaea sp.]|nr:cytochrome ubiquinol oxidase subunit I [Hamadaea sp.]
MREWLQTQLLSEPEQLLPARTQMALTLMFHIILVPLGVALPTLMLIANYKGLRRADRSALLLARRWSHVGGVTFAVGAVSGTVLSFEMGLLWPGLTGIYGDVFGLPFAIEGIAFFLEAILIAIYIYGWRRLRPWTHFWLGVPIPFVSIIGAFSIIAANSWMNNPSGFTPGSDGRPTNVDPGAAIFNKGVPLEFTHFIIAAYMAAGFMVASVYAVGWLKGRRDRYHRLGFLIPFTLAAILTPVQFVVGDSIARWVADNQPAKFAAMEVVTQSGTDQTEIIFGRYDAATGTVSGGIRIPGLNSILVGFSRDTYVQGMNAFPAENLPSNVNIVHWAFDIMVNIALLLILIVLWFAIAYWRKRQVPSNKVFLWLAASAGVLAYIAIESGWIVTEVGRQPWIVYNIMRTSDAVTHANGVWASLTVVVVLYTLLGTGTIIVLRAMTRRWRTEDHRDGVRDEDAVYGPRPPVTPEEVGP